ncbi:MAG: hypothetical protein GTO24_27040, partial [candidate division Zixibacteria bacterium]|nr:hypothetical protein [candidate division Zixibacteria bacterium]
MGGPFSPPSQTYELENRNALPIEYEVTHTANWVTLSGDVSGLLPALGTAQVTVEINSNAEALSEGEHHAAVYFTNLTDH